jgi:hypothetical protein
MEEKGQPTKNFSRSENLLGPSSASERQRIGNARYKDGRTREKVDLSPTRGDELDGK